MEVLLHFSSLVWKLMSCFQSVELGYKHKMRLNLCQDKISHARISAYTNFCRSSTTTADTRVQLVVTSRGGHVALEDTSAINLTSKPRIYEQDSNSDVIL